VDILSFLIESESSLELELSFPEAKVPYRPMEPSLVGVKVSVTLFISQNDED